MLILLPRALLGLELMRLTGMQQKSQVLHYLIVLAVDGVGKLES